MNLSGIFFFDYLSFLLYKAYVKSLIFVFQAVYQLQGEWVWTDGSAWDWEDWGPSQPNNRPGENCLLLGGSSFYDAMCTNANRFVCKI
jgi:hypothetical protein